MKKSSLDSKTRIFAQRSLALTFNTNFHTAKSSLDFKYEFFARKIGKGLRPGYIIKPMFLKKTFFFLNNLTKSGQT